MKVVRDGLLAALTVAPLVLLIDDYRYLIEGRMLLLMVVEFPLLLASGAAMGWMMRNSRLARAVERIDYRGLTTMTVTLCVSAYWMIPAALDDALLNPFVAAGKYLSWWLVGWLLASSWRRMSEVFSIFLFGNLCWMVGSAGLLYESSEARLCVNYLFWDQQTTGQALIGVSIAMGVLLAWRAYGVAAAADATAEVRPIT